MEKSIEELILQELKELKMAVNSLGVRMDALEARMDRVEASIEEMRCACNTFLEWADNAYENMHRFPRIGDVGLENVKGKMVKETRAQYYVAVKC